MQLLWEPLLLYVAVLHSDQLRQAMPACMADLSSLIVFGSAKFGIVLWTTPLAASLACLPHTDLADF
jgi:hypothetical protein